MIIIQEFVQFSLDINDVNEAIVYFLKSRGYETFNKVTIDNLQEIVNGGKLVLNGKELAGEKTSLNSLEESNEATGVFFPNSLISRLGGKTQGLEMFLYNVPIDRVYNMINELYSKLNNDDKNVLNFVFHLDQKHPDLIPIKTWKEIETEFTLSASPRIEILRILNKMSKELYRNFQQALSENSLSTIINIPTEELLKKSVFDFNFSVRTKNALKSLDVNTVEQLQTSQRKQFNKIRNAGTLTFKEIENFKSLFKLNSEN